MSQSVLVAARVLACAASRIGMSGWCRVGPRAVNGIVPHMPTVAAMPTVAKEVHADKGDANQEPKPVCHEPLHGDLSGVCRCPSSAVHWNNGSVKSGRLRSPRSAAVRHGHLTPAMVRRSCNYFPAGGFGGAGILSCFPIS